MAKKVRSCGEIVGIIKGLEDSGRLGSFGVRCEEGKMYGLLIDAIVYYIKDKYGEAVWSEINEKADICHASFATHETYSELLIPRIAKAASEVTGVPVEELMDSFGMTFVGYVGKYGYDRILKVLGRNLRDFLNGLDNLHEYLRFSYPKMKPPSFFCEAETRHGLTLHYRSKRKGFVHYVKGQIRQVAKQFYNTDLVVEVKKEEITDTLTDVIFELHFDNTHYKDDSKGPGDINQNVPLRASLLLELFPFHVVFGKDMIMQSVGSGLEAVMSSTVGREMAQVFCLLRPLIEFNWSNILIHTNVVFELISMKPVQPKKPRDSIHTSITLTNVKGDTNDKQNSENNHLHLKGQMMYMSEWDAVMFLGTPLMESLDTMFNTGLYINDLSMHDSSRDLVLAGTQQSVELKLALDQEQQKSRILEESMRKLDAEMKRTDTLLYQMIPKTVADRLRKGEPSVNTCEVFDNVTILFSDVVGFTHICSQISPMEVVSMLNAMYTKFDQLSEIHKVYKVETIGDAYMVVSGAPTVTKFHALHVSNMALDMLDSMRDLKDPSTGGNMKIRVGVHSGTTVAGVVGIKMPRYCLFGDSVNIASRMETHGEAMNIHVSETTKKELEGYPYVLHERGGIDLKGKGRVKTYWLIGRREDAFPKCPFSEFIDNDYANTEVIGQKLMQAHQAEIKSDTRSLYSPVTFEDVDRSRWTTPSSTPSKSRNNELNLTNLDNIEQSGKIVILNSSGPQSPINHVKENGVERKYSNKTIFKRDSGCSVGDESITPVYDSGKAKSATCFIL